MKQYTLSLLAITALTLIHSAHGAVLLLSSNNTGGNYPGNVTTVGAGASYTWQNLGTGNGPGNTDAQTLSQDPSFTKMKDGGAGPFGGNFTIFSTYGGNVGQTSIFDLGTTRSVDYVTLCAQVSTNQQGIGYFTAYTSNDGTNFTLFGRWSEVAPADSQLAVLTIDPAGSVNTRYVMFYTNRYAGSIGETALPGQATYYQQAVLGEQAVWGTAIPEPASWSLLMLGGAGVFALRYRRHMAKR